MIFNKFLKQHTKEIKHAVMAIVVAFITVWSIFFLTASYLKEKDINFYLNSFSNDLQTHITLAGIHLQKIAKLYFELKINKPSIKEIMFEASRTKDPKELALLHKKLYNLLKKDYEILKKYGIRQMHFHLPNAISFVRFHRPNKYGDSLIGIRPTIEYVNKILTPIYAFEEGRIFNGFRNVFPLFQANRFIGTVELSLLV